MGQRLEAENNGLDAILEFIAQTGQPRPRHLASRAEDTLSTVVDSLVVLAGYAFYRPSELIPRARFCARAIKNIWI